MADKVAKAAKAVKADKENDMKITQEADYALRMVCLLARESAAGRPVVGATNLATGVAVPTRFGLKILHKLSRAGLVRTSRGMAGGYSLNVSPETLTMRCVIEAIDGPITLNRCLASDHDCLNNPDKEACRLHHVFDALNTQVVERLDRLTVSLITDDHVSLGDLMAVIR